MAIAIVQETNFQNAGSSNQVQLAYGSNVAAGNMLVVFSFVNNGQTFTGISDTLGAVWTALDEIVDATAGRRGKGWIGQVPVGGGANTVTVTFSGSTTSGSLVIAEISGATVARLDGHIAQAQSTPVSTSANAITTGSGAASTNAKQPALIYAVSINFGSGGGVPTTGTSLAFVTGQTINGWASGLGKTESFRLTSTGAQAATWTAGATTASGMSLMVILDEGIGYNLAAAQGGYSLTGAPGAIDAAVPAQSGTFSYGGFPTSVAHGIGASTVLYGVTGFAAQLVRDTQYVLLNDAITLATQAGLMVLRPVAHAHSDFVPYGSVIAQVPPAGISVKLGTMVILTASDGPFPPPPPTPNVPNVLNMRLLDAQQAIEANGCNVNSFLKFQNSGTVAQGLILAQSPSPSGSVPAGTLVTLTVSLGIAISYYGTGPVVVPVMH